MAALARSFDEDPLFRWMLPDPSARFAWTSWFHRVSVDNVLPAHTAFTLEEGPDRGAITIIPPGGTGPSVGALLKALTRPPKKLPTSRLLFSGLRIEHRVDSIRPRAPLVYVHVLGVCPTHKGKGYGGALLGEALKLGAKLGVPVYLETANPVNLGFYGRYGLKVREEFRIGDAPTLWTLQTDGPPTV